MQLSLNVVHSQWRAPDFGVVLAGGRHDLPSDEVKLKAGFVRQIAAAAAAGALEILEADAQAAAVIEGAVELDEQSLVKYEAAVASGAWLEGHLEDVVAQRENRAVELREQLKDESLDEAAAEELLVRAEFNDRLLEEAKLRLAVRRGEA